VRNTRTLACLFGVLFVAGPSLALQSAPIQMRDIPGSNQEWQEGQAVINAPAPVVLRWLTQYEAWKQIFPDIEWVQRLGVDRQQRDVVKFRSKYAGRTIELHQSITPKLLVYEGWGPNVHTQGRVYIIDLGRNRTRVLMQTSAEVHGLAGVFATKGLKRSRAFQAIRGHLAALLAAAAAR
jgi:hypothetical protein